MAAGLLSTIAVCAAVIGGAQSLPESCKTAVERLQIEPQSATRIVCSIAAAREYRIPANIVLAVAQQEGGQPGQWVGNTNGTYDVGPMQFNTAYLGDLKERYGITAAAVATDGCYPYRLAAWRLRQHLVNDGGNIWKRVANYHSRTPSINADYRAEIIPKAAQWAQWLAKRFDTKGLRKAQTKYAP